jgi:1-acyl-sn-glycerol-3-phosphate acyltransferase
VVHLIQGLLTAGLILPWVSPALRLHIIRSWSAKLLAILNVSVKVSGQPPATDVRDVMFVANHISWLDVFAMNAVLPMRFIAKSEIRGWPVFGWLCEKTGTFFIERTIKRDALRINREITLALSGGDCVAFFPEGTTTDGTELKPFLSALLQPIVSSKGQLWPVALRYKKADGALDTLPAFIDDMSFTESLQRILCSREIHVELNFLAPVMAAQKSRLELARYAEEVIARAAGLPIPCRKPETPADLPGALLSETLPTDSPYPTQ